MHDNSYGACYIFVQNPRRGRTCKSFLYIGRHAFCNSPVNSTVDCTLDMNSVTTVAGSCTIHKTAYTCITHHPVTMTVCHKLTALHFANGFAAAAGGHLMIFKGAGILAQEEKQKKETRVLFVAVQHPCHELPGRGRGQRRIALS